MHYRIFQTTSGSPRTAEWLAWRHAGLGSSDAGCIATHTGLIDHPLPWQRSIIRLYHEKTNAFDPDTLGETHQGGRGEEPARLAYEALTGMPLSPMFGEMDHWPVLRASFDGMSIDGLVAGEFKCPNQEVMAMAASGIVAEHYLPQLAHLALAAWDLPAVWPKDAEVHFGAFHPGSERLEIVRLHARRDLATLAGHLLEAEKTFWTHVTTRTPLTDAEWSTLAKLYLAAEQSVELAQQARNTARDRIIAWCTTRSRKRAEGDGLLAYKSHRKGTVDYPKLIAALGIEETALAPFRRRASTPWVVQPLQEQEPPASESTT